MADKKSTTKFPFLTTGAELQTMTFPEPDWIVEDLILANERRMSLLCGQPGSSKSTLARVLCTSVLKGIPFLGKQTRRSDVLYWQTEGMGRNIRAFIDNLGYDSKRDAKLTVFKGMPKDNTIDNMHNVLIHNPDTRLVIIETLDEVLKFKDILSNTFVREGFDRFDNVLGHLFPHVAFLGLAHLKKTELDKSGNMILGASEIAGRTGIKMYLRTHSDADPRRIFHTTVRADGTAIEPTYLEFDAETGMVTLGETLRQNQEKRTVHTDDRIKSQIVEYVVSHPDAAEQELCGYAVSGKAETKKRLLRDLVRNRRLCVSGKGVKGDPRKYNLAPIPTEDTRKLDEQIGDTETAAMAVAETKAEANPSETIAA